MNLTASPALADNSRWMIDDGAFAIVVAASRSAPAVEALDARCLQLAAILVTGRHADRCGGVRTWKNEFR